MDKPRAAKFIHDEVDAGWVVQTPPRACLGDSEGCLRRANAHPKLISFLIFHG
jgi:hypothetical protein